MFDRQSNDIEFVARLNEELRARTDDRSNDLHVLVAATLQRARRQGTRIPEPSTPTSVVEWRSSLLRRHALTRPDGRPLYRYRITDDEYERAASLLTELAQQGRLDHPDDQSASLFAAYCSEWFRREAESTFRKWENLAPQIFGALSQAAKAELTEKGLRYWGRLDELIRDDRGRQFLLTLALEGGFSAKLLRSEARGWLKDYLTALIREGLAEPDPTKEAMQRIANAHAPVLRESYRQPEFLALCAELILTERNSWPGGDCGDWVLAARRGRGAFAAFSSFRCSRRVRRRAARSSSRARLAVIDFSENLGHQPVGMGVRQNLTVSRGHQAQEIGSIFTLGVTMRHAYLVASWAIRDSTSCAIQLAMRQAGACR